MGLLGWIKKDKRHRRRESAPPKIGQDQDVAYLEAMAKFNDWRAQQRNSDINSQSSPGLLPRPTLLAHAGDTIKEEPSGDDSDCEGDFSSDIELARDEHMLLSRTTTPSYSSNRLEVPKSPRYARHHRASTAGGALPSDTVGPKKPKRSVEFYRNINRIPVDSNQEQWNNGSAVAVSSTPTTKTTPTSAAATAFEKNHSKAPSADVRFSLPVLSLEQKQRQKRTPRAQPKPNNTIYENEVAEFEANHMNGTLGDSFRVPVPSPPRLFYKSNSSPYANGTPKKQSNLKARGGGRNYKEKGPAPAPPVVARAESMRPTRDCVAVAPSSCPAKHRKYSDSDSPLTGSYRNYELTTSSMYDEHVISSRGYRGSMKRSVADEVEKQRQHRKSLSYQTVVNKHGDLVDYALPFSDNADTTGGTASETHTHGRQRGQDTLAEIRQCEQMINENFQFLQSTAFHDDSNSIITEPISVLKGRSSRIVTDLDRSAGSTLKDVEEEEEAVHPAGGVASEVESEPINEQDPQDILLELDSLQKWSKSIQMSDDFLQTRYTERNLLECFRRSVGNSLLTCFPNEVRYRVGSLRSAFAGPLEFSCGLFRGSAVTLRKYSLNTERSLYFAEEACKRDFEVLSQVRHSAMAILMAVSYDAALNQATLLLEPFDFTLFDYIHRMNKRLSLVHAITVVQQISSAVCYLQECGYIHSNISSGCILMRRYPYAVKLTSFELTTESSPDEVRREIENRYGSTSSSRNSMTSSQNDELKKITTYARLIKNDEQFLRDKYRKLSKEVCENRSKSGNGLMGTMGDGCLGWSNDCRTSRFLPYCKEYREKFSLFHYVAPELLVPKSSFVYPNRSTDVYSIALLLWEILNGYVPFVVYSRAELEKLHTSSDLPLPMFEKERCERFRQIFEGGLGDMGSRKMSMGNVVDLLDCLLLELGMEKNGTYDWLAEDYEELTNLSEVRLKNELNDVSKQGAHVEKTDKIYFLAEESESLKAKPQHLHQNSPSTNDPEQPKKPARKINRMKNQSTEEQDGQQQQQQQQPASPPAPNSGESKRRQSLDKKSPISTTFNLSNSGIYQTIFDFNNKFLSPKSATASKQVIYDRTSTVKKHKKPPRTNKKSAKELFEVVDQLNKSFTEPAQRESDGDCGPLVVEQVATSQEPPSINIEPIVATPKEGTPGGSDSDDMHTPKHTHVGHASKSCDSSPGARRRSVTPRMNNSFRFTIGDFTLPDTPIARKNKIRKHAWLSDQKLKMTDETMAITPEDCRSKSFFNAGLATRSGSFLTSTNLNCSTSLQDIKPKRINISVNIIKSPDPWTTSVTVRKRHQSVPRADSPAANGMFEKRLWRKEKTICERSQLPMADMVVPPRGEEQSKNEHEDATDTKDGAPLDDSLSIITAHLTSVRDAIKKIETTFENHGFDYSPIRKAVEHGQKADEGYSRRQLLVPDGSLVVAEHLLVPTKVLELEKTLDAEAAGLKDDTLPPPVPQSAPPPVESESSEQPQIVTRLNMLLACNQPEHKEEQKVVATPSPEQPVPDPPQPEPARQPRMISQVPSKPTPIATTAPVATFAPNSQLYLRRQNAINTAANSVATIHQRTVYQESIVSSTDHGVQFTDVSTGAGASVGGATTTTSTTVPPTGSARKKKLTTRVTVNMRKISRRASDISPASSRPNSANLDDLELPSSGCITPTGSLKGAGAAGACVGSVRHSCGNELLRAFSKLRLVPQDTVDGTKPMANGGATTDSSRSVTPVGQTVAPVGAGGGGGRSMERFICCNCGNSMVPVEGFNVPTGSRIGMTAAFGEINFPKESFASMFEPPLTPTSASALASRLQSIGTIQKSTEDLYIDDDFCQGLSHMGANMELVEPLDEGQYLDAYDIYSTEIYHAEEEEEELEEELEHLEGHPLPDQMLAPINACSTDCTDDEAKFLEKCTQLNSESLKTDYAVLASPIDCVAPVALNNQQATVDKAPTSHQR
ncbi:uncharacterized protein LOC126571003 [Anopheles aquasalis]|uniref:uncharacterized protein LOC126571003 n=1 Tax=Anopheles aquasalis TaxID=42839 RepID=UPI00215ACB98|nr:uncharacterized protein LOC126571003 [Anopheles aquasalis]